MTAVAATCGQLVPAALFTFAAATKLRDFGSWRGGASEFLRHGGAAASTVAAAVPAAELLGAAGLLTPVHRYAAVAALVMLACFSLGVGANLLRGRSVSCNCFGSDGPAGWSKPSSGTPGAASASSSRLGSRRSSLRGGSCS